jgi:hypothetical protein
MRSRSNGQTLLGLGWLDYVETQNRDGRLFPHLRPNKYGHLSATWSTWFNEYLDVDVGIDDPRVDFHSLRHTRLSSAMVRTPSTPPRNLACVTSSQRGTLNGLVR